MELLNVVLKRATEHEKPKGSWLLQHCNPGGEILPGERPHGGRSSSSQRGAGRARLAATLPGCREQQSSTCPCGAGSAFSPAGHAPRSHAVSSNWACFVAKKLR